MKNFIKQKGIKQSVIANALELTKGAMTYKIKNNSFSLAELKKLYSKKVLNEQDILEIITK